MSKHLTVQLISESAFKSLFLCKRIDGLYAVILRIPNLNVSEFEIDYESDSYSDSDLASLFASDLTLFSGSKYRCYEFLFDYIMAFHKENSKSLNKLPPLTELIPVPPVPDLSSSV